MPCAHSHLSLQLLHIVLAPLAALARRLSVLRQAPLRALPCTQHLVGTRLDTLLLLPPSKRTCHPPSTTKISLQNRKNLAM